MKRLPLLLLAGATLIALAQALPAQTKAPAAPADPFIKNPGDPAAADQRGAAPWQNCMLVLETYALDKTEALAVLETGSGSAARYRRVLELAKAGKARLDILTALTTRPGQRAHIEAIDEVRYATEFAVPTAKGGLAAPTAYETRNVGDTLELEVQLGPDGRTCDLNVVPQRVGLLGFRDIGAMVDDSPVSQPRFASQRITTSANFPVNEPHYLGSLSAATERGAANGEAASEMRLAFVRLTVAGPTAEEMKPPAKPMDWSVLNFEYRIYSLDRAAARDLLAGMPELKAPWKNLQALLGEKKARLEHLVSVQTKSGQRAVTEEVQEVRYATEYAPAARPSSTETTTRTATTRPGGPKQAEPNPKDDAKVTTTTETATITRSIPNADVLPGSPTAFEVGNAGVTIELEPTVGPDGVSIDLNHDVKSVTHLGDLKTTGVAARYPAQPLFENRKLTSPQTLLAGRQMLIGTFNPPGANGVNDRADTGRTWLVFVRATPNEP